MGKRYWIALKESFPEKQEIARESRGGWAKNQVIAFDWLCTGNQRNARTKDVWKLKHRAEAEQDNKKNCKAEDRALQSRLWTEPEIRECSNGRLRAPACRQLKRTSQVPAVHVLSITVVGVGIIIIVDRVCGAQAGLELLIHLPPPECFSYGHENQQLTPWV